MREYGVERDLAVYNQLLDIFPKEVFRPRNFIQHIFIHYPRQQQCGVAVLEQMENHGVMPNKETEFLLIQIFGRKSHPMLKFLRLKRWFPRFMNINPFPVPRDLSQDPVDLATFALRRIEPDLSARVTVYQTASSKDSTDVADPTQPHIIGKSESMGLARPLTCPRPCQVPAGPKLGSLGLWGDSHTGHRACMSPHQESRVPISRLPWLATTQPGLSLSRVPSPCGSETSVCTTTSSELTCCPWRRGKWKRCQRSGTSTTRCRWTIMR
uniref:ECSIT signaling integrator n=1 Tax=Callithrix jacchus TaxID=9483 RepID=A0A8I3W521_CALJA